MPIRTIRTRFASVAQVAQAPVLFGAAKCDGRLRCNSSLAAQVQRRDADSAENVFRTYPYSRPLRRSPKVLSASTSNVLTTWLARGDKPLTWEKWSAFREIAGSRSLRFPVVTMQMAMRRQEAVVKSSLSECLPDQREWSNRMNSLAAKGITEDHISCWLSILSESQDDAKLERFLSTETYKPPFLLFALLSREATFRDATKFDLLLDYVQKHYSEAQFVSTSTSLPPVAVEPSLAIHHALTPDQFVKLLRLLVPHCLRTLPSAIAKVSQLVSAYINTIPTEPPSTGWPQRTGYDQQCLVFNRAIQLFAHPTAVRPLAQSTEQWQAQKDLIAFSTQLERQLILTKDSYQAIRRVMVGMPKSLAEQQVAQRASKTWPPYRRELDGVDERRLPEENLSRSVHVGRLMQEAGYAEEEYDLGLGALGGNLSDSPPTIQSRSPGPKKWQGHLASLEIFSTWATKVKATRNAQEAWQILQTPPQAALKPNYQVYAEVFDKIFARPADGLSSGLPGDSKEAFPVQNVNLTAFEMSRLQPPSVENIYEQMLLDGNRPVGKCLSLLLANASSRDIALRYLQDSPFREVATDLMFAHEPPFEALKQIPLPIFNAFITFLCRHRPRVSGDFVQYSREVSANIRRAIKLISLRLPSHSSEGRAYKASWHNVLAMLATPRIRVGLSKRAKNEQDAVKLFLTVYDRALQQTGHDAILFEQLCRACQKLCDCGPQTTKASRVGPNNKDLTSDELISGNSVDTSTAADRLRKRLSMALSAAFKTVTQPPEASHEGGTRRAQVPPHHNITAKAMYLYMRALAFLDAPNEMTDALNWLVHVREGGVLFQDAAMSAGEHRALQQLVCLFRAYAEPLLPPSERATVRSRVLGMERHQITWPEDETVESFVRGDYGHGAESLWGEYATAR